MKKIFLVALSSVLLLFITACGNTPNSAQTSPASVEYSYVEDLNSLEAIMRYSSNIVKAELTSVEDFNGTLSVYTFRVSEDYTNNTPNGIHMYDAYNDAYIVGHTYYLFLSSGESALYPHTIYTTVVKDFVIDDDATSMAVTSVNGNDISVSPANIADRIESAVASNIVAEKVTEPTLISNSTSIESVSASADVIAEISVSNEVNSNIYSSAYAVSVVSMVKGSAASVPSSMILPPYLDQNTTYYIMLKESPNEDGEYSLFSRSFPVIPSASNNAEKLLSTK